MRQQEHTGLIIGVSLVIVILQLFNYWATMDTTKKITSLEDKVVALKKNVESWNDSIKKQPSTPATWTPASTEPAAPAMTTQGKLFPLVPDPLFQRLPRGKAQNQTLIEHIMSSEKGFNRILESSANITLWHDYYSNDTLAQRHWENPDKWAPHLAEHIEVSEDNREFTIHLRKNVRWHPPVVDWNDSRYDWLKGDHYVTSQDFYFTYTTIMNPQVSAGHLRTYYENIESFTIIDDHTFVLRWTKSLYTNISFTMENQFPTAKFLFSRDKKGQEFPSSTFGLEFNKHWYNDKMMGCGPYRFLKQDQDYVDFTRNDDYYGYQPSIERVRFHIVKDDNTAYMKLKARELNIIPLIDENIYREDIHRVNPQSPFSQGSLISQPYPRLVYYHVKWNNMHPIFRNKMVRRAMTYAFNREEILKNICMGLGTLTVGGIPYNSIYYNKNLRPYPYDLNTARKILENENWRDDDGDGILEKTIDGKRTPFQFSLYYGTGYDVYRQTYAIFQEDLLKIGVKMTPVAVDWPVLLKKYQDRDFEAAHGVWTFTFPVDFYQIWHSKFADEPKTSNQIRFKNEEVDDICQKMREAVDVEERIKLAHRMQEIWHEEQPYTFLFFRSGVAAYTKEVQNRFIRQLIPHILTHPYYMEK